MTKTKKRVFEVKDGKPVEVKQETKPVVTAAPAKAETPVEEKKPVLTAEAFAYRNDIWASIDEAKVRAVRAMTSLAVIVARFGQENIPVGPTDEFKAFIASAVEEAGKPRVTKVPQFTSEAWGLVRNLDQETLSHIRGGAFNGKTGVTLDEVLIALYLWHQPQDEKHGEMDLDGEGQPMVLVCGCGICNGRKFVRETWQTGLVGNGPSIGNYVPGNLIGSAERFVPVSRRCLGRINKAVFEANAPIAAANAKIARRRNAGERTEQYAPMKPLVHGLTSQEANRIAGSEQVRQARRQASGDRLAAIVEGLKPKTKTGVGQGGASAYPTTRRGHRGDENRF